MKLGVFIALAVTAASFCPRSEAQDNKLTPGAVVSWGNQLIPYAQHSTRYKAIAAGGWHSLALKSDGTVAAWGNKDYGQTTVPASLTGVIAIAAGFSHSLALKSDGTVVAWGTYGSGQSSMPANLSGVIAIAAGWTHSLALKSDGTLVAWGGDYYGQSSVPANLTGVIAISAGFDHSLAIVGPPPALSISLTTTNVLVSWPGATAGYRVEVTGSLSPPVKWNPVTTMANLIGNRYELTLPIANGAQFFRLIKP